ncbi:hypothetical protein FCM35_KLT02496 [Carex littledalei]|uniref:Transmembrane protein n=1 Tax=Carex littledalei TaxID=544730 RepID=A0A833R0D0_9POAL|nr:hypothetical protein FCM35_KLT02496 [Carex littledalei]
MAITHEDISHRRAQVRRTQHGSGAEMISSRLAVILVGVSIVCALITFVLCLAGEASRSEATWYLLSIGGSSNRMSECFYNGNGKTALACAIFAFLLLAVAMFAEHAYMLVAVASPVAPSEVGWTVTNDPRIASATRSLTCQTCFLFLLTWQVIILFVVFRLCFAIAEVLLIIGVGVESGHLTDWRKPRPGCHVMKPGMFAAAGILGLISVFLGFMVYLTALRSQKLYHGEGGIMHHGPHNPVQHAHIPAPTAPHELHPPAAAQTHPSEVADKTSTSV